MVEVLLFANMPFQAIERIIEVRAEKDIDDFPSRAEN